MPYFFEERRNALELYLRKLVATLLRLSPMPDVRAGSPILARFLGLPPNILEMIVEGPVRAVYSPDASDETVPDWLKVDAWVESSYITKKGGPARSEGRVLRVGCGGHIWPLTMLTVVIAFERAGVQVVPLDWVLRLVPTPDGSELVPGAGIEAFSMWSEGERGRRFAGVVIAQSGDDVQVQCDTGDRATIPIVWVVRIRTCSTHSSASCVEEGTNMEETRRHALPAPEFANTGPDLPSISEDASIMLPLRAEEQVRVVLA